MKRWNVVVIVREHCYPQALQLMQQFGTVEKTHYYDVMVMDVPVLEEFLEETRRRALETPDEFDCIGHITPCTDVFVFQTPEEFETQASEAVRRYAPALQGKRFHVRMHRRGFKGQLHSLEEERFLDGVILAAVEEAGGQAEITFDDPDAIVVVETVDGQAGLGLWTRDDLERYPLIRLD